MKSKSKKSTYSTTFGVDPNSKARHAKYCELSLALLILAIAFKRGAGGLKGKGI